MKLLRRFHEFPAHEGGVNCATLGRASGTVIATGGEDMKLNVWHIGNSHPQKSLLANKSPVEAVCFDPSDEYVASGSSNSVVTLWDLPNEKAGRTFDGHQTAVRTVQFHPSKGYYLVSGALDASVKIWDARRKACIHTFTGRSSKATTYATFSPDGKWITAGFGNGEVELWDIRRRTQVMSFTQHRRRVNGIQFHPNECIMATWSQDGTVRLWDLDNAETIDKINTGEHPPHSVCFSTSGDCIYTAIPEGLLCHSWEPNQLHSTVTASLHQTTDMVICQEFNRLIICTTRKDSLGPWAVDLDQFGPHKSKPQSRRSSSESVPSLKIDSTVSSGGERRDSKDSDRPNSGHLQNTSARFTEKYAPGAHYSDRSGQMNLYNNNNDNNNNKSEAETIKTVKIPNTSPSTTARTPTSSKSGRSPHKLNLSTLPLNHRDVNPSLPPKAAAHDRGMISSRTHAEGKHQRALLDRYNVKTDRYGAKKEGCFASKEINVDSFLPKTRHDMNLPDFELRDEDCIQDMVCKKDEIRHVLSSRLCDLQIVRKFWDTDDVKETLKQLKKTENPSVTVDFFEAGVSLQKLLTLELVPSLVPLFEDMMQTEHEKYWTVALKLLLQLLKGFGGTIRETINGSNMSIGVNLAFEQRHEKCKMAQECLLEIRPIVEKIGSGHGEVGVLARDISGRLSDLTT